MRGPASHQTLQYVVHLTFDHAILNFFQIGGLIAHTILFWGAYARDSFKLARAGTQPDPHYQVQAFVNSQVI